MTQPHYPMYFYELINTVCSKEKGVTVVILTHPGYIKMNKKKVGVRPERY